jgi:hypothetical protein
MMAFDESWADFQKAAALDPELSVPKALFSSRFHLVRWIKKYLGRWMRAGGSQRRVGRGS